MINERKIEVNLGAIKSENHYIKKMADIFSFPSYFGGNLDALDECMRDLSWFPEEKIFVEINNIERLKNKNIKLYLHIKDDIEFIEEFWTGTYERISDKEVFFIYS